MGTCQSHVHLSMRLIWPILKEVAKILVKSFLDMIDPSSLAVEKPKQPPQSRHQACMGQRCCQTPRGWVGCGGDNHVLFLTPAPGEGGGWPFQLQHEALDTHTGYSAAATAAGGGCRNGEWGTDKSCDCISLWLLPKPESVTTMINYIIIIIIIIISEIYLNMFDY